MIVNVFILIDVLEDVLTNWLFFDYAVNFSASWLVLVFPLFFLSVVVESNK